MLMAESFSEEQDDESHAIAHLGTIDVRQNFSGGIIAYGIAAETPLRNDERTRKRLLKKMENYLLDYFSERDRRGMDDSNMPRAHIFVKIPLDSDAEIFDFLASCRPWLDDNHADLHVSGKDPDF
jgi:hypothetical protein